MADSVNNYTNSTAAMALLSPTVSFAQRRADRDRQLQYQAAITADAQDKQAQAQQAEIATQQAVAALREVPFLEQDQARFGELVDSLLADNQKIVDKDYAGDHERYARERFAQDTANLITRASKNPLFKQALKRRQDFVQLTADQAKGLIDRPVTYRLLDGSTKTAPATQNYLDFTAGKTAEFQYQGGYAAPTKWNEYFSKNYHPNAAVDPAGKFKTYQAGAQDIMGAMLAEDGMNPQDAADYLTRFGNRLGPVTWRFDPRDPLKETALKQRDEQIRQQGALGRERNAIGWQNARTAARTADTNAAKLKLDKQMRQGFNAYGITLDPRNITTTDASGLPASVPATVQLDGKVVGNPWALVGYDAQLIQPHILSQLGIKPQKTKDGVQYSKGRLPSDTYVVATNKSGGVDLRLTDLTNSNYQVVGAGQVFRRASRDDEKSAYQKAGGPETLYQQITVRLTANEALKAKRGKLFQNVVPGGTSSGRIVGGITGNVDSITGAGAYREVDEADRINGERTYEFDIVVPVTPTAATRVQMEGAPSGRYLDSKAGVSTIGDYNNESAPVNSGPDYILFDDLDND